MLYAGVAAALLAQAAFSTSVPRDWQAQTSPGAAPSVSSMQWASLGETTAAAYAMSLYVQTFDAQAGRLVALRTLDAASVSAWLERAAELAPDVGYPLFLATRMYAETAPPEQARTLLDGVERAFARNPNRHWPWMAHAVYVARHRLHDMPLAQRYARVLRERASAPDVPAWARDMEFFLLTDLNEVQAARVLLGGLIASGRVTDERELALLAARVSEIEKRH